MKTNSILMTLRQNCVAVMLFLVAGAAQAVDVTGTLINQEGKSFTGSIKWKGSTHVYVISAGKIDLEMPPAQIKDMSIPEPAGYADAIKAVKEGRPQQAIPVLDRIAQDYVMLQWDEPATRALTEAYLKNNDVANALRACDKVISAKPEAAYAGEMAPLYWQALLKSDRTSKLEGLLDQAIKTGGPEATAFALIMRGDSLSAKNDFKGALKDGYLRVITLYRSIRSAQPEALFKASKAFDQINQASRAEIMRKQLLTEFGSSEWASRVTGGK